MRGTFTPHGSKADRFSIAGKFVADNEMGEPRGLLLCAVLAVASGGVREGAEGSGGNQSPGEHVKREKFVRGNGRVAGHLAPWTIDDGTRLGVC